MKRINLIFTLTSITAIFNGASAAYMYQDQSLNGSLNYLNEKVSNIVGNGNFVIENSEVENISINGQLNANNSIIGGLKVNGQLCINKSTVRDESLVNGRINAKETIFEDQLQVCSQKLFFQSCKISSIVVNEVKDLDRKQIIILMGNTEVKGSINVISGKGEVWISPKANVLGSIIGAEVIKK